MWSLLVARQMKKHNIQVHVLTAAYSNVKLNHKRQSKPHLSFLLDALVVEIGSQTVKLF